MTFSGEQLIRTLRHYLQTHEAQLLSNKRPAIKQKTESSGFIKAFSSLWTSTNRSTETIELFLSDISYIQQRSTLTLDIHYLHHLLTQFQLLGLEDTQLPIPEQPLEKDTNNAPSILSVGSTFTLSGKKSKQASSKSTLHEDITYIHGFFKNIRSLKIHLPQSIEGYNGAVALPLTCFKNLTCLELCNVSPHNIELPEKRLTNLVIRHTEVDTILSAQWPQLKMLLLEDNNLTTLEGMQSMESVTHLNISRNLLIDIPAVLASMYNLTSLNLSYNMIEQTNAINTVLGNIHDLDLRGNRLTNVVGLDSLWSLEKLDLRDNQIEEVAEIERLKSLPNISHLWVKGNPFTEIQTGFELLLFKAFQEQDITLDGVKPSASERRRIQIESESTLPTTSATIGDSSLQLLRAKSRSIKRQVRLGQMKQEVPIPAAVVEDNDSPKFVHRLSGLEEAVQQEQAQLRKATSLKSRRSSKSSKRLSIPGEEKVMVEARSSHAFRMKIEAMRREAGTEWLKVLQEMDVVKKEALAHEHELS